MISQYFLSLCTANFSLNYFVPFFQGQHFILSYSHSCLKVFPFLPGSSHCWPWASRWAEQMPCEELSGISGPCQADARLPISSKPCQFVFVKWKKMECSTELGTERSCWLGSVKVLPSHQVLLVGGEGIRAAVCLSSPPWLKGWINLQWAVSSASFLLLSASASRNEAAICLFWQVQPTWSLRSVTLIGNNLKVLNYKISYRKRMAVPIFFSQSFTVSTRRFFLFSL